MARSFESRGPTGGRLSGHPGFAETLTMCGITGIWNLGGKAVRRAELENFTRTLRHRGPDGEGFFFSEREPLGLGHRRLTVMDLSENGRQPMSDANHRY